MLKALRWFVIGLGIAHIPLAVMYLSFVLGGVPSDFPAEDFTRWDALASCIYGAGASFVCIYIIPFYIRHELEVPVQ